MAGLRSSSSASELAALPSEPGDRLRVQLASQRFSNRVTLKGAVQRPGVYGHFPECASAICSKTPM